MNDTLFTVQQALQLVALGPCLFVMFFLLVTSKDFERTILPVLYFLSLACSFLLPLADVVPLLDTFFVHCTLLYGQSLAPALSFLLILQFLFGRRPSAIYWAILAIPLIGGSTLVLATVLVPEACSNQDRFCIEPHQLTALYEILSSSLIFLLLVTIFFRTRPGIDIADHHRRHKYWLIIALIGVNLALIAIDLGKLSGWLTAERAIFSITLLRLAFIYLVLTSVFRVFDKAVPIDYSRVPTAEKYMFRPIDTSLIEKIKKLMEEEKLYREMRLTRDDIAKRIGVGEHVVSRVVNAHFGESVTQFVNNYRIEEAKMRLVKEAVPVTTIAFETGFNSIASFNRVFKEMTGVSPTDYRQTTRKETSET